MVLCAKKTASVLAAAALAFGLTACVTPPDAGNGYDSGGQGTSANDLCRKALEPYHSRSQALARTMPSPYLPHQKITASCAQITAAGAEAGRDAQAVFNACRAADPELKRIARTEIEFRGSVLRYNIGSCAAPPKTVSRCAPDGRTDVLFNVQTGEILGTTPSVSCTEVHNPQYDRWKGGFNRPGAMELPRFQTFGKGGTGNR